MDSRKDKIDSPRLTCRDPEGRARLMPDVDLMAAIERLCQQARGRIDHHPVFTAGGRAAHEPDHH